MLLKQRIDRRGNTARKYIVSLSVVAALIVFLFLPIQFPFSIETPGKIALSQEWILYKGQDGRLISTLIDHQSGITRYYTITQTERADAGRFEFDPVVVPYRHIQAGDTVGRFYSNEVERQYVRLQGELATALASLSYYSSGEKPSVIREARKRLELASKEEVELQKIMERQRRLYKEDLISEEEYEVSQLSFQLTQIKKSIAEAELQTVSTGVKQEQIDYLRTNIEMLQDEMRILRDRIDSFVFISPISGIIKRTFSGDTLITIADTASYVLFMPLKLSDLPLVSKKQTVEINPMIKGDSIFGEIMNINNEVHTINSRQVVFVTASIDAKDQEILPGLITHCKVSCEPLTLFQHLKRTLTSITIQ